MRAWAEHLAAAGLTVPLPRLPGHGTRWQDANRTPLAGLVRRARARLRPGCAAGATRVFVMGLSMGGTLALRLAEQRGDDVAGLVRGQPVAVHDPQGRRAAAGRALVVPSFPPIGNDIKKPGRSSRPTTGCR